MTAAALRRLRRQLGLSQARFAALVGVIPNTVARWERGEMKMSPPLDRLVRLSVAQGQAGRNRAVTRKPKSTLQN